MSTKDVVIAELTQALRDMNECYRQYIVGGTVSKELLQDTQLRLQAILISIEGK